ncbi:hypothetical protein AWZ03_012388 [Drosophila navojoa]|uniref:BTB domain-containing protein n=2 Tax=Drosophila navojoa TaxID=7232 RepID=A0A484AX55_DRONA|nr:hypothetical protein AWZ03_012388 [Drosophila navojoa]
MISLMLEDSPESIDEVQFKPMPIEFRDEPIPCHLICDQAKLMAEIANIVQNRILTDVQVVVHGTPFDCHLAVLHIGSDYFKQFPSTNKIVIDEPDVTVLSFEKIYEWMINSNFEVDYENCLELYLAVRFLQIPRLIELMWIFFESTENISEGRAFQLYVRAIPYSIENLQALMLTRLNRFFLTAVTTQEYINLTAEQVYAVLTISALAVNSEMEVFMSVFRWMMYDWAERKKHSHFLMQTVRFNLMPAWYILSLKTKPKKRELAELLDDPIMQDTLDAALSYTVTQHFITKDSPLTKPLELNTEHQREWIIDCYARHHHLYNCPNWVYLDYKVFDSYMEEIIKSRKEHFKDLKLFKPSNFAPCCRELVENCETLLEI